MRRRFWLKERRRALLVPVTFTLDLITMLERGTIFCNLTEKVVISLQKW